MKKTVVLTLLAILLTSVTRLSARGTEQDENGYDRQQFFKEMRDYKHRFLAKELGLTKDQQSKFFPIYDEMEDATTKLNDETREMERRIAESTENITDLEYEKATEAMFDLKINEGQIEKEYMNKFADILSKKQLFMLKSAEKKFNRELISHQMRLRSERNQNRN
ncbi:MAG: Spy/CpxP family protein refolding chaperone [Muribaculaceae bacterium]|nr:Spy/CpxP family protein refolding chaperone [Muribaculaceae bacterium]